MGELKIEMLHFDRMDTILLRFEEQNRLPCMQRNMPEKSQRIAKSRWSNQAALLVLFWLLLGMSGMWGCDTSSKQSSAPPETPAASRPPLKVWIVDAPELEKEIAVRWQAASDQALKIESMTGREAREKESFAADVVIYPGHMIGEWIKKDGISKLPVEAVAKRDTEASLESLSLAWPARWRSSVSYGGQIYAVPLGSTNLAMIQTGLESAPLDELQNLLASGKDLKVQSIALWEQFLENAERRMETKEADRKQILQDRMATWSEDEKSALLDRFLFIASTTNARSRGLFDLLKMESRLGQSDFVQSAKIFVRLAQLFPATIAADPTKAWDSVIAAKSDAVTLAIGLPSPNSTGLEQDTNTAKPKVLSLSWNPVRGLVASVGRKTKQTAVSCQFLVWLCEPEQRESLRIACPRVELAPDQSDRNSARDDYRAFQSINNRDSRLEPMELSLRMANADQYRAILTDSLMSALKSPDEIETIMANCAVQWNQLTTNLGIDSQRISEEKSLGYRK